MDDQPTCGKGLAEHSLLPAKLAELTAAVAEILELHILALDLNDPNTAKEHDAYRSLVKSHRRLATQLEATAQEMSGYRDLPMGKHDETMMSSPNAVAALEEVVRLEQALLALLQHRLEHDREMLGAMGIQAE